MDPIVTIKFKVCYIDQRLHVDEDSPTSRQIKQGPFKPKGNIEPDKEPMQQFRREPLLLLVVISRTV
jgi:hypothetical protein